MMDHDRATRMHASERYLLDELSPEERDDFEAHYFACSKCADEVRSAFAFADNARSVFSESQRLAGYKQTAEHSPSRSFWAWLRPAAAAPVFAVLLLAMTLYQSVLVIPRLERALATATQPRVLPSVVARAATRGEEPPVDVSEHDEFLQLILDINPTIPVASYICEVYDAAGTLRFSVPAPAANGASLNLLLPATDLTPGRFIVRVRPNGATESHADEYSFVLRRKQ